MLSWKISKYEQSFRTLLPQLCKKLEHMEDDSLIIRFLQKMGDDFPPVLSGVLEGLSDSSKDELLCWIIQSYGSKIVPELNCALAENCLGQYFQIEGISAQRVDGRICLSLSSVVVDYNGLLQNRDVQEILSGQLHSRLGRFLGSGLAGHIVHHGMNCMASLITGLPDSSEQTVLSVLERLGIKNASIRFVEDILRKNGLYLQLLALQIRPDQQSEKKSDQLCEASKLWFPHELEEALLDSAAAFLREAVP